MQHTTAVDGLTVGYDLGDVNHAQICVIFKPNEFATRLDFHRACSAIRLLVGMSWISSDPLTDFEPFLSGELVRLVEVGFLKKGKAGWFVA